MTQDVNPTNNHVLPLSEKTSPAPKQRIKRKREKPTEWLSDQNLPVRGETALWVAVITQALMDALSRAPNSEAQYHKHEAINWLTGNSRNFITVCHHAGLDPDYVRRKAKRALLSPTLWRAEPGKGNRYHERKIYRNRMKSKPAEPAGTVDENKVIAGPWTHKTQSE